VKLMRSALSVRLLVPPNKFEPISRFHKFSTEVTAMEVT
jgi:hypothetical protein